MAATLLNTDKSGADELDAQPVRALMIDVDDLVAAWRVFHGAAFAAQGVALGHQVLLHLIDIVDRPGDVPHARTLARQTLAHVGCGIQRLRHLNLRRAYLVIRVRHLALVRKARIGFRDALLAWLHAEVAEE